MALEHFFPDLARTGYAVTSPATPVYNCIAWAAGVTDDWWWPDPMGVSGWPAQAPRAETTEAFLAAFESLGYVRCDDPAREDGFEKVALWGCKKTSVVAIVYKFGLRDTITQGGLGRVPDRQDPRRRTCSRLLAVVVCVMPMLLCRSSITAGVPCSPY